jgi:acyl-coenzyme A thioesterase PaaI-like protein
MIVLKEEISSQENMEAWLSQLGHPDNPISNKGLLEHLKPRFVSCDFEKREACIAFDVFDWELNPGGSLHGGIILSGFDISCGLTCHYYAKQHMISTINLTTTFLKPILPGDTVNYHVRITSLGRTIVSMTAEARLSRKNILAATATATFMKLDKTYPTPI